LNDEIIKELILSIDSSARFERDKNGRFWIKIDLENLKAVLRCLKEKGYDYISAITALDNIKNNSIELLYHLMNNSPREFPYLTISITISRDDPKVYTVHDILPAALIHESEVFDLMGVKFEGNPLTERLLLPGDVPENVHPLKKEFKDSVFKVIKE